MSEIPHAFQCLHSGGRWGLLIYCLKVSWCLHCIPFTAILLYFVPVFLKKGGKILFSLQYFYMWVPLFCLIAVAHLRVTTDLTALLHDLCTSK